MAKHKNSTTSQTKRVSLSRQSWELLEELAQRGIYGRNPAEVAGRFVDRALQRFVELPRLNVKLRRASRKEQL
jgi:hypothetical protein